MNALMKGSMGQVAHGVNSIAKHLIPSFLDVDVVLDCAGPRMHRFGHLTETMVGK